MRLLVLLLASAVATAAPAARAQAPFDIETGNAAVEVVIPTVAPVIFSYVSPSGGDATLILRVTTLTTNAWFDATAPYHDTAVGVYTRLGRRPAAEATLRNLNTAILHASFQVFNSLLPAQAPVWRQMLIDAGLDPDDASTDPTTAVGLGNSAGEGVVIGRENDGMNQLGYEVDRGLNPMPYADYTGYEPRNTPYELKRAASWQPDLQRVGMGVYKAQQFVTPQYALVEPYSYASPKAFEVPPPVASYRVKGPAYRAQADEVLAASANLTDEQKLKAEFFDDKIRSLGFSVVDVALQRGLGLLDFVHLDFVTNMAAFDAGIVVWQEKRRYDTVRPFSAIREIHGDELVAAWGGPGAGTTFLPASEWRSYLEEADHPEYPSGSTCFCAAHAQAARNFLGDDVLNFTMFVPAGQSRVEPGITPLQDTTITFPTWTDFSAECGQSRVWAGVHFQAAVDESAALCGVFGDLAYDYLSSLIDGTAPPRPPSVGAPLSELLE